MLFKVINRFLGDFHTVFKMAESKITVGAEQPPNFASGVAMVYIQGCYLTATSASSTLVFKHL
jgi:hypothetical protein